MFNEIFCFPWPQRRIYKQQKLAAYLTPQKNNDRLCLKHNLSLFCLCR